MQQTLTVKRGTAWLRRFEGVVLHSDRDRETHVSSSGGGGYVGPHGGYVAPPQITSTTSEHQIIFARDANGMESRFQWTDWTLPVRPGSRIAVVWGAREGYEGRYVGATNLDTREELWRGQQWVKTFGLATGGMHGWLCFCLAFIVAWLIVLFVAYVSLGDRARPEQIERDAAAKNLAEVIAREPPFVDNHVPKMNRQQQLAYAHASLDQAERWLQEASKTPFSARRSLSELLRTVQADNKYVVTFFATWGTGFLALLVYLRRRVVSNEKGGLKPERIDKRLRSYLRTGVSPP